MRERLAESNRLAAADIAALESAQAEAAIQHQHAIRLHMLLMECEEALRVPLNDAARRLVRSGLRVERDAALGALSRMKGGST